MNIDGMRLVPLRAAKSSFGLLNPERRGSAGTLLVVLTTQAVAGLMS